MARGCMVFRNSISGMLSLPELSELLEISDNPFLLYFSEKLKKLKQNDLKMIETIFIITLALYLSI